MLIPFKRGKFPVGDDNEEDDIAEFQQKIASAELPAHALKAAEKELKVLLAKQVEKATLWRISQRWLFVAI